VLSSVRCAAVIFPHVEVVSTFVDSLTGHEKRHTFGQYAQYWYSRAWGKSGFTEHLRAPLPRGPLRAPTETQQRA
jgi:hypothetical protein